MIEVGNSTPEQKYIQGEAIVGAAGSVAMALVGFWRWQTTSTTVYATEPAIVD
jgi:hypothetical protein